MSHTVDSTPLGKDTEYPSSYDASILCPISRLDGRIAVGLRDSDFPFKGVDYWNAYEVSWLNLKGKPEVGLLELGVPAESPNIVESKSLKLYLNSLNQHKFSNISAVINSITNDIEAVIGAAVDVKLHSGVETEEHFKISHLKGECIDALDIEVSEFDLDKGILRCNEASKSVSETLYSHLLRSNCPVTSQPDWASVMIRYEGKSIDRESLLKYIISYRTHNEFHEQCVERMFLDILEMCEPESLTVYARYTRRGGIDINPFRSNFEAPYGNLRVMRQ